MSLEDSKPYSKPKGYNVESTVEEGGKKYELYHNPKTGDWKKLEVKD